MCLCVYVLCFVCVYNLFIFLVCLVLLFFPLVFIVLSLKPSLSPLFFPHTAQGRLAQRPRSAECVQPDQLFRPRNVGRLDRNLASADSKGHYKGDDSYFIFITFFYFDSFFVVVVVVVVSQKKIPFLLHSSPSLD